MTVSGHTLADGRERVSLSRLRAYGEQRGTARKRVRLSAFLYMACDKIIAYLYSCCSITVELVFGRCLFCAMGPAGVGNGFAAVLLCMVFLLRVRAFLSTVGGALFAMECVMSSSKKIHARFDSHSAEAQPPAECLAPVTPSGTEPCAHANLRALQESLLADDPRCFEGLSTRFPELAFLVAYMECLQSGLTALCRGAISTPVGLDGYTGTLLRELQASLNQVMTHAQFITSGDFSPAAGNMGEVSTSFNNMGKALQLAFARLEQQKDDLAALSTNLRREIEARAAVEQDLRREQLRLHKLASTDPLTDVANRRHFFQLAGREMERSRRSRCPVSLAMLDVDHFKDVNDTYGHVVGDEVLRTLATIITHTLRPYDLVGRYGGDEFIFLFPETPREVAHTILERLRNAVEKKTIAVGEKTLSITTSIGLTRVDTSCKGSEPLDEAILRADNALYMAKEHTRNCVFVQ